MSKRTVLRVKDTRNRDALRGLLIHAPDANGYLLGDLDSPFFERCRWFVASLDERVVATVLLYEGLQEPCLLSAGAPDGVAAIFSQVSASLPQTGWAKVPGTHKTSWEAAIALSCVEHQWMMASSPCLFQPRDATGILRELSIEDVAAIEFLLSSYPGNYFEPSQVRDGRYVGAFSEGRLLSVAGTHVYSIHEHTAVVANVVTDSAHRGRGLAQACVSRLIELLRDDNIEHISLQVDSDNAAAITCYRRLGFVYIGDVLQARYTVRPELGGGSGR